MKHTRSVHLIAERHHFEVGQLLPHGLMLFRLDDKYQKAAATGSAELSALRSCLDRTRIVPIDLCVGDLRRQPPLERPAKVKGFTDMLELKVGRRTKAPQFVCFVTHLSQDVDIAMSVATLLSQH